MFELFEAADAFALEGQSELALDQKLLFDLLNLNIVAQRFLRLAHIVGQIELQFGGGQFAFQLQFVLFQMA
jgi:hypothetical protein